MKGIQNDVPRIEFRYIGEPMKVLIVNDVVINTFDPALSDEFIYDMYREMRREELEQSYMEMGGYYE